MKMEISSDPWWEQITEWRKIDCLKYQKGTDVIKPQAVIEALHQVTEGDALLLLTWVAFTQMWAAQFMDLINQEGGLTCGGLGTMGFGLPAAMGVQLAFPDEKRVCVTERQALLCASKNYRRVCSTDYLIKIINLNNRYMGMVRQWQEFFYDRRYSHSYMDALPDFVISREFRSHRIE